MAVPKSSKPHGYARVSHHGLQRLVRHPSMALVSHWCFQSLFYMHRTERMVKLGLELVLTVGLGLGLTAIISHASGWFLAWGIAHTINVCCNGHVWGVLKHFYPTGQTAQSFERYREQLMHRITQASSIATSEVIGSAAHTWTPYADLDIRLIRHAGLLNGIRAGWFGIQERSRAFIARFPLDLYILDPQSHETHA